MDNYVHMRGRLVANPSYQVTVTGLHRTKFRIASNGRKFDKDSNGYVDRDPVFMSVVCWRQLADNVAKSLRKGDTVMVYGRLTFSEYDDANGGPRRQSYEIDAVAVAADLSLCRAELVRPVRDIQPTMAEPGAGPDLPEQPSDPWGETESAAAGSAA